MSELKTLALGALLTLGSLAAVRGQDVIIVDNTDPGFTSNPTWTSGTFGTDRYGPNYQFADSTGNPNLAPTHTAQWVAPITQSGYFDVSVMHSQGNNRASDAPFTMVTDYGNHLVRVNQKANGGVFNSLGMYHWSAGQNAVIQTGNNATAPSVVIADAVRLTRISTETLKNEYRFFWVSRFQWPSGNANTARNNINNVFQTAADNNFNAVFFQVRGQMDTHYPSPYEPWTNTYNWTNPGWNPLQYAIDQARARDIEFHAYINTHTISGPVPPSNTTPQHKHNLHGPAAPPGSDKWAAHNIFGNPIVDPSYVWLSPGVPEASAHTRREVMHVVDNYDIDGLHFDRIRTSQADSSYDPISVARFEGDGNPNDLGYQEFMRDQFTRDLRKIYGAVQFSKPNVAISAAPIGISRRASETHYQGTGNPAYHVWQQDSWDWLQSNVMDFVVPQIYWEVNSNHPYEKLLQDWVENAGDRWIVPGSRTDKTIASQGPKPLAGLLAEWQAAADLGAMGNCFWQWQSLSNIPPGENESYYSMLRNGPYKNKVSTPEMPWKTNPTTGFITGYILDDAGAPVLDARIKLDGDDYTYLSAWDGFFSIVDVKPGTTHTISATKYGVGSGISQELTVLAGEVTSHSITLDRKRGFAEFFRTRYYHDDTVQVRLYDADLSTAALAMIRVASPAEPLGETVVLSAEGGGRFSGTFNVQATGSAPADQILQVMPGSTITVEYLDANDGSGLARFVTDTAQIRIPDDIIVESRTPAGGVTPNPLYQEMGPTGWANTPTTGPTNMVVKSRAPGLSGLGARRATATNAQFRFLPAVPVSGHYNIYVTLPGADLSSSFRAPGTQVSITRPGKPGINTTVDLSSDNPQVAGQWMLLAADVELGEEGATISFTNTNAQASDSEQFGADAVKLVFERPIGVNSSVDEWNQFR